MIVASYSSELSEAHSRAARGLLTDPQYPFETAVAGDSSAVNRWDVAGDSGGVIAAGILGALTGHGGDLIVVDDAVKDREAADSAAVRESTWRWWSEVF